MAEDSKHDLEKSVALERASSLTTAHGHAETVSDNYNTLYMYHASSSHSPRTRTMWEMLSAGMHRQYWQEQLVERRLTKSARM